MARKRQPQEGRDFIYVEGQKLWYAQPKPLPKYLQEQEQLRQELPPLTPRQTRMIRPKRR